MSVTWTEPDIAECEYGKPPSIWWCVIAFVVVQIAGIVITILTWEQGKSVISGTFFVRALLLPLFIWGAVTAVIYTNYEEWIARVDRWNYLCRCKCARWKRWARSHVAILGSVALTPEPELAERLVGLEGRAPMNPGKIMALPETEASAGVSRIGQVIERLIAPFAARVMRLAPVHTFEVMLHSEDESDINELQAVWRKLALSDLAKLRWAPLDAKTARIEQWFDADLHSGFRLVLGCQLHREGKEPVCSEAAVAILLASPAVLDTFERKLKPQARLFRPISVPPDSVTDAVDVLLAAEQTTRGRIRHMWSSGLSRQGRHATSGAIKDARLNLAEHDVDGAIGKPGPVNGLLLQALAAQMVEHGQGVQLIASPDSQRVMLNLLGTQVTPVPHVGSGHARMLRLSTTIGVTCCIVFFVFLLDMASASAGWFWGCLAAFVLLFPLQIGGAMLTCREVEEDFHRKLRRSPEQV
ncbi:hypothetical protein CUJ89_19360 [Burkholderia pyrrocinia]|uniref:Uncharacterized protein n=1 Tax=Burkholderia pyrrocinia TaxID=60550 RepID=A0A2Z5N1P7_BURPY|nr:hypothetical protein [Burkholderia pyrrocinia]AXF22677.1 hypothetical protein CUJ89_19360 [Burkholderia pyrrocinia]